MLTLFDMKYKELIKFEPINDVIKFNKLDSSDYRKSLIETFVFSKSYEESYIPVICKNLDFVNNNQETMGIQIVGSYGTGKSHLMSLFSIIAEDESYLQYVKNENAKTQLAKIAGKYNVLRFELGNSTDLWSVLSYQIDKYFEQIGFDFKLSNEDARETYINRINKMLAYYEEKFPNKGFMIVIDEMLSYLKGRSGSANLNEDLAVLQAFGHASDRSKFRIVFGVQELIYKSPEFQFAANMLNQVQDRYRDLTITKEDVLFIVQERLLSKDEHQKQTIRNHLSKFTQFFTELNSNLDQFVNLFPVNPSYIENFQKIRIAKSQREILKTLSARFESLLEKDVPENEPGLICYDEYWNDMANDASLKAHPDVRKVLEITETIYQKIDSNFTGGRKPKIPLAKRITNACAIKILQEELSQLNGVSAERLVDDLCYLDAICDDREMLMSVINTTADNIKRATVGSYFDLNTTNLEYHIRIEGGVNYEQKIEEFAEQMTKRTKDEHFFNILAELLPIEVEQYRREFRIWPHNIAWNSHKTTRDGYIFMGNPNERSTTQPIQHYYIYFTPIFDQESKVIGNENDSIYVLLDNLTDEVKKLICLVGSAESLRKASDSSQQPYYAQFRKKYLDQLKPMLHSQFFNSAEIIYKGEKHLLTAIPGIVENTTKDDMINKAASFILENHFNESQPNYPKFANLLQPLTPGNFDSTIKGALKKVSNPQWQNRNAEAILFGLGLWNGERLSTADSIYARSIKAKLDEKSEGMVLNRDEILEPFYLPHNKYVSNDEFKIEADFVFIALAVMTALGEIEIVLPGNTIINATSLNRLDSCVKSDFYSFEFVRRPRGVNMAVVKKIFMGFLGHDLSSALREPATFAELGTAITSTVQQCATLSHALSFGIYLGEHAIISDSDAHSYKLKIDTFKSFCEKVKNYNSEPKLRNLPEEWTVDAIREIMTTKDIIKLVEDSKNLASELSTRINYLSQARSYATDASLISDIESAIAKLSEVVRCGDRATINAYKSSLDTLASRYARAYVDAYLTTCVNEFTMRTKEAMLQSEQYKVCDLVRDADFINGSRFETLKGKLSKIHLANPRITEQAVLDSPFMGFNPHDAVGVTIPDVNQLKEELDEIYNSYDVAFKEILDDPSVKRNIEVLNDIEKNIITRYIAGEETLNTTYTSQIKSIIAKLHRGFTKVEISADNIQQIFNRPMTPEEAIEAFKRHINNELTGRDRSNVRIIVKLS